MPKPPERIPSLDGLRAVSILLVLIGHLAYASGLRTWTTDQYARAGVLIFFVISGYLITRLMRREVEQRGSLQVLQFYRRRMWRILPVFYVYLGFVTIWDYTAYSRTDLWLSWTHLASFASYFGPSPWNLSHLWSLSVEELFYLAWPLVVVTGFRNARWVGLAAIFLAPVSRYLFGLGGLDGMAHFSLPGVVDSVAMGCLLAIHERSFARWGQHRLAWIAWPVALVLPSLGRIGNDTTMLWPLPQLAGHGVWTVFNGAVAVGILWAIAAQPRVLNCAPVAWLGRLSYSLYLWHMPWMNPSLTLAPWTRVALALASAAVSYYSLERPLLRLRDRNPRPTAVPNGVDIPLRT